MREHWSWTGAVGLVLAIVVGGGWAAALILVMSPVGEHISDTSASLLTTIGGVLAGALATFLGAAMERRATDDPRQTARPVPPPTVYDQEA